MSDRRSSRASSSAQSPKITPYDKRPSVSTVGAGTADSDSDSDDDDLRYATPPIGPEAPEPKTPDIPPIDGMPWSPSADSENDQFLTNPTGSPTSRTRQRRSLHRTLRDSHGGSSHRRSHKDRESGSANMSDDTQDSEQLTRGKGSFTVHGRKASVIRFGSDWHNTTAEERLKTKKQLQEAQEPSPTDDRDGNSIVSNQTATALSTGMESNDENTPRKFSADTLKQRHVATPTTTSANFVEPHQAHDSDSDNASDMSDITEETPAKEPKSAENANHSGPSHSVKFSASQQLRST